MESHAFLFYLGIGIKETPNFLTVYCLWLQRGRVALKKGRGKVRSQKKATLLFKSGLDKLERIPFEIHPSLD